MLKSSLTEANVLGIFLKIRFRKGATRTTGNQMCKTIFYLLISKTFFIVL